MKNKKPLSKELLSERVFFRSANIRNEFFAKLKTKFGTWAKLRKHFNIYKSRLERFMNGQISIPYNTFLSFLDCLDKKERHYFLSRIILKDSNWGRVKGGISTYKKHKDIFIKGREIGGKKLKYHFKFDIPLNNELCELLGNFIGDGFTNKYNTTYMIQFTGDYNLDKEYYLNRINPIIKKIGPDSNPILAKRDNNTLRLTVYSKEFYNLLTKRFKFKAGKKVYSVTIPKEILESKNQSFINYCIRGIFDTDGSVYFYKRGPYKRPYIGIGLKMESKRLIKQIYFLLLKQDIRATITKDSRIIQINGFGACRKFVKLIGFSNQRHLNKIKRL